MIRAPSFEYSGRRKAARPGVTKEMKRLLIRSALFAGSYLIIAILLEILTFVCMGLGVLPTYFGLDLAVILIIALIILVIPNAPAQLAIFSFVLVLQIVLSIANEALYSMSGMVIMKTINRRNVKSRSGVTLI